MTPNLVDCPFERPNGRTYFDWNSDGIKEWKKNAIQLQNHHVKDNNQTLWFKFSFDDRFALERRILIILYGLRIPQSDRQEASSCLFTNYNDQERAHARLIKRITIKHSNNPNEIYFNHIYASMATKVKNDDKFYASEEPVFAVLGKSNMKKFIDKDGRVYANFEKYKDENTLPKAALMSPKDGSYKPENGETVILELNETPSTFFLSQAKSLVDKVVTVGGIVLAVSGVVTCLAPALLTARVATVLQAGSFFLSSYSLLSASYNIGDKTIHDESIRTDALILLSAALTSYSGYLRKNALTYAKQGRTFNELLDKIGNFNKVFFDVSNILIMASSSISFISFLFDFMNKREHSWLDYYQFSMSIFMFFNVLTNPKTLKGVFESEQMVSLKEIGESLESDDARQTMKKVLENHTNSDKKAHFIRNIKRIENQTEFFELVKSIKVICTADGLSFNEKIDISPEAYNDIGRAAFEEKLKMFSKLTDSTKLSIEDFFSDFSQGVDPNEKSDFDRLKELSTGDKLTQEEEIEFKDKFDKCSRHRKKYFFKTTNLPTSVSGEMFDLPQDRIMEFEERMSTIKHLSFEDQKEAAKNIIEEFIGRNLNETEMSSIERKIEQDKVNFKKEIKTFCNAKYERLCYRIHVDEIKQKLKNAIEVQTDHELNNYQVNNVEIFKNMKTSDYDRLMRVFSDCKEEDFKKIFKAVIFIANDQSLPFDVHTSSDIASIAESLFCEANITKKYLISLLGKINGITYFPTLDEFKEYQNNSQMLTPDVVEACRKLTLDEIKAYNDFRENLIDIYNKVEGLGENVISQWTNKLTMVYHWKKHKRDFGGVEVSVNEYFNRYSTELFSVDNIIGSTHSQVGGFIKRTYARPFGTRAHVGFTFGESEKKLSHYVK